MSRLAARATRVALALIVSLALAPALLTGCGGDDNSGNQAGDNSGDVDVDHDPGSGELTVSSSEGTYTVGDHLPAGFPVDDIPVIDGRVVSAVADADTGGGKGGFVVMMQADTDSDTAMADALGLLTDAGFVAVAGSPTEGTGMLGARQLTLAPYTVLLTVIPADAETSTVQYIVQIG